MPKKPWKFYRACEQCSYRTTLPFMIDDHKKRHKVHRNSKIFDCTKSTLEKYRCTLCSIEYATLNQVLFKRHMKIFHGIQLGRQYETENIQDISYNCRHCDFKTYSQMLCIIHYSKCSIKSAVVENEVESFKCSKCSYYTKSEQFLDDHKRRKHPVYVDYKQKPREPVGNMVRLLLCDWCDFFTMEKSILKKHMLNRHDARENDDVMYACKECSFKTKLQVDLYNHVRNTHICGKFTCKYCPYYSNRKQLLDIHMETYPHFDLEYISSSESTSDVEMTENELSKTSPSKSTKPALFSKQPDKQLGSDQREDNEEITYLGSSEVLSISSGSCDVEEDLPLLIFSKSKNLETDKCKQPALFLEQSDKELESGKREENEEITYLGSSEELSVSSGSCDAKKNLPLSIFPKLKNLETDKSKQPALFLEQSDKEPESGKREENEEITYLGSSEELSVSSGSYDVEENLPLLIFSKSQNLETEKSKEPALFLGKPEKELESGLAEENEEIIHLVFSEGSPVSSELSDSEENQTPKSIISIPQNLETSKRDKMYKCELCSSQYTFKVALMNHMFNKHPARAEQIYFECPKCRFRATTHNILNRHVRIHHKRDSIKEKNVSSKEKQPRTLDHFSADSLSNVKIIENELVNKKFASKTIDKSKDLRFFPRQPNEVIDKKKFEWGIENEIITLSSSSSGQLSIVSKSFNDEENQSLSVLKQSKELETFKSNEISERPTLRKDVYLKCPKCHFRTITEKLLKTHLRREHKIKFIELTTNNILAVEIMENELIKKKSSPNATDESDESLLKRSDNFIQKKIREQGSKDEERISSDSFEEPSISSRLSDIEENQPLSVFSNSRNVEISKSDKIHKCKVCPSQYDNEIDLVNHMLHKHPILRNIYLKCPNCHFRTITEKLLKAHLHREHKIKFIEWATDNSSAVKLMENKAPKKKSPLNAMDESDESRKKIPAQGSKDKERTSSDSLEELTISSSLSDIEESQQLSAFFKSRNLEISKSNDMYKCTLCSSKYLLETALVNHMFLQHPTLAKEIYIKCPKCNFRTAWLKLLKTHIRREHKIKFIECGTDIISNVEMMEDEALEKNSSLNTTDKSEDIDSFEEPSDSHCSSDSEENQPFLVFPNSKDLQISKCDKMYKCDRCSSQYVLKETLMKHMFYKHPKTANLQCSKCRFQTTTVQSLKEHLKSKHKKVIGCGTNNKERKKQERKCNIKQRCIDLQPRVVLERLNIQPPIIQEVEKSRRKKYQRLEQKQAAVIEGTKWLKCESCAFKSIDCSELKWHILTVHVAAEPVICFKCQLCTFRTIEGKKLNEHILEKHIDPLSLDCFSCEMCTNKYQKAEDLKKHIFEKHIL